MVTKRYIQSKNEKGDTAILQSYKEDLKIKIFLKIKTIPTDKGLVVQEDMLSECTRDNRSSKHIRQK